MRVAGWAARVLLICTCLYPSSQCSWHVGLLPCSMQEMDDDCCEGVFHDTSLFSHVSAPLQPLQGPVSPCLGHRAQRLCAAMCLLQSTVLWMLQTSYSAVLFSVFVCSLGAMLFGLHLGIVNGPLDAIAADLGFAANPQLKGAVSMLQCAACAPSHLVGFEDTVFSVFHLGPATS